MLRPDIDGIRSAFPYLNQSDWGAINAINDLIEYIEYLEAQDRRRDWPSALHEQYLAVLDERDELQEKIDELNLRLSSFQRTFYKSRTEDCEHEWDVTSVNYGPPGGDSDITLCVKCGAVK